MHTDMNLIKRWPQPITLDMAIHYERGTPDRPRYLLTPCERMPQVRIQILQHSGMPLEMQRMDWLQLPGRTLYLRSLSVLAVHLFGAVEMPPRVCGAPLWQHISVGISTDDHSADPLYFELVTIDDRHAELRYRCRRDQPLIRRALALDKLDADPLRALLRVGATCVRPAPRRSAVPVSAALTPRHWPATALTPAHTTTLP